MTNLVQLIKADDHREHVFKEDVYKRQSLMSVPNASPPVPLVWREQDKFSQTGQHSITADRCGPIPVSYTHLDVYKRQVQPYAFFPNDFLLY